MHSQVRSAPSPALRAASTASATRSSVGTPCPAALAQRGHDRRGQRMAERPGARALHAPRPRQAARLPRAPTWCPTRPTRTRWPTCRRCSATRWPSASTTSATTPMTRTSTSSTRSSGAGSNDPDVMSCDVPGPRARGHRAGAHRCWRCSRACTATARPSTSPRPCAQGLATASNDPSFPGESYGNELMQLFIAPMHTDEQREWTQRPRACPASAGASLMAFMMRDVNYSADFLTGAADKLDEFEQLAGRTAPWAMPARGTPTPAYSQFNESEDAEYADPMAEMMRALSRQPEVGYDFITEEDRADFYFDKRDWSHDEYDGIAALADRVSTDPDVYGAHPRGRGTRRRPVRRPDLQLGGLQRRGREGGLRQRGAPALDVHALDRSRDGRRRRGRGRRAEPPRWAEGHRASARWITCRSSTARTSST